MKDGGYNGIACRSRSTRVHHRSTKFFQCQCSTSGNGGKFIVYTWYVVVVVVVVLRQMLRQIGLLLSTICRQEKATQ